MITLQNECLRVQIAEPGEHPNDGCRFDRAGFITEVVLNNERSFTANEPKNLSHPSTGGKGFCSEFRMDLSGEAKVGECYPKLGIGLIKKETDEPYSFFGQYEIEYFPVSYTVAETSVTFTTEPIPCQGYAVRMWKTIRLEGNSLITEHKLENLGEKSVGADEYCHNFISVDGMAISPDYSLTFCNLRSFEGETFPGVGKYTHSNYIGKGHGLGFKQAETDVSMAKLHLTESDVIAPAPFRWKVEHAGAKACVEGEDSYMPEVITVWSTDHIVSPEVFNPLNVAPGETYCWSRKLTFIDKTR